MLKERTNLMKSALIVWGGWEGHEPEKGAAIFAAFLRVQGYHLEIATTLDMYLDEAKMQSLNRIVPIWTIATITPQQEKALLQAVQNGTGLAGWHGCMADSFRANPAYQFMVGGQWVAHPGGIIDYEVQIVKQDAPITRRIQAFPMHSAPYYLTLPPPNA